MTKKRKLEVETLAVGTLAIAAVALWCYGMGIDQKITMIVAAGAGLAVEMLG